MIASVFVDISLIALVALISFFPLSSRASTARSNVEWRLPAYLAQMQDNPGSLINSAEKLFAKSTVQAARKNPALANAWQDRLAMLAALSQLFDPALGSAHKTQTKRAAQLIESALLSDPALLVRDAAVESIRRINRMRPGSMEQFKKSLETAFLSPLNQSRGEGYFIRETILAALREGSLRPNKKMIDSAQSDANSRVKAKLDDWNTSAF